MYSEPERKIPFKKAVLYVLLSVVIIWGSLIATWLVHQAVIKARQKDPRYNIVALVQTCPQTDHLQTWQLAELLDLSRDAPQNLYSFDPHAANGKLLTCPVIKKAVCRRQPPCVVHVDYVLKEPCALIADFSNVAIDREKFCFPLKPYFTPKKLPQIYLGLTQLSYEQALDSKEVDLAFKLLDYLEQHVICSIETIDVHNAFAKSAGAEEIVVVLDDHAKKRYLRLNPRDFTRALDRYKALQSTFDKAQHSQIIDLRIPQIALFKELDSAK